MEQEYELTSIRRVSFLSQWRENRFLRHNLILFLGAASVGALNYIFYPIMGRILSPTSFGEVQALFSLFAQITIFLNVLSLLTVNIVANYDNAALRDRVVVELEKVALLVSGVLLIATIIGGSLLKNFFHFGSSMPFIVLVLALLISTPLTFRTGYLRGKQKFGLVSYINVVASALDLIFAIFLVVTGRGTTGAVLGLVIAQALAFGLAISIAKKQGFSESLTRHLLEIPDLKLLLPELKYAVLVLIGSLTITGLYSIDTVVVKHYFDARTAGLYAGIATIARIIFFATTSVAQVLLPSVKLHESARKNRLVLRNSFFLLFVVGAGVLALFVILPKFIIRVLMGSTYLPYANLLPKLGFVVFLISLLNLFIMYHMALRRYFIATIAVSGTLITTGLIALNHQSLSSIINSLLGGSLSLLVLLGIWLGIRKYNTQRMEGERL